VKLLYTARGLKLGPQPLFGALAAVVCVHSEGCGATPPFSLLGCCYGLRDVRALRVGIICALLWRSPKLEVRR
jgi:hypothetical protein